MKLVKAPEGSHLGGQAVLSMLIGLSLERVCELVGEKPLTTSNIVAVVPMFGVSIAKRRKPCRGELPDNCVVYARNQFAKKKGRWFLLYDGEVYDPNPELATDFVTTSYLELKR